MILFPALLQPFPLVTPQNNVVDKIGCGTGCQIRFQQLSPMEMMEDGWRKVKVRSSTFIWDYETNQFEQKSFRGEVGSGVSESWNYANCQKQLFTRRSKNYSSIPPLGASGGMDFLVFKAGKPIFETVFGSPFQQWAVMCPLTATAKEGNEYLNDLSDKWKEILKDIRRINP